MNYFTAKKVSLSFEDAIIRVTEELRNEGFGVLTEIDIQGTLKKKLDVDFRRYKILGACNPYFAHQALLKEDHIGVLLPCNIVVQEKEDGVEVAAVNPMSSMQNVDNSGLGKIAGEVSEKLAKIIEKI